jgi:NAD(P)-dependent dehydrogenase (short-subunit alcohol dehydrogenase family)
MVSRMRIVVVGANRGIGLEFVRQYLARGERVEATARNPAGAEALAALATRHPSLLRLHACDVSDERSVAAFTRGLEPGGVDLLINNAGVMGAWESLEGLDLADVLATFSTNALGPIRVTRALLPKLREGKGRKVAHLSSKMGSISDNSSGGAYAYRMSKAALNMASKTMAVDLRGEGILSVVLSPGWVKTDMGGANAPTDVKDSVAGMVKVLDSLGPADSGRFLGFKGEEIEW